MTGPRLRQLHPGAAGEITPAEAAAAIDPNASASGDRPYLLVNMVASADGKVVLDGRSGGLGNEADKHLFHALRGRVDAVMMGAGTLRTERYGRVARDPELRAARERAGLAPDPLAVVVSGSLALSGELPLLQSPEQEVVVLTSSGGEVEGARARIGYLRARPLTLRPLLGELRSRGIRSVLCEGGPTLNGRLFSEGLVDELFLTLSPLVVGGAQALTAVAGEPLPEPERMELLSVLEGEGFLHLRYSVGGA